MSAPKRDLPRIVSLVPSHTQTLAALGARLVGATRYCIDPPDLEVRRIGGTKTPDVDVIVALAPDLVVANEEENRLRDVAALRAAGLEVVVTFPKTIAEGIDTVDLLADAAGIHDKGQDVSSSLRIRLRALAREVVPADRGRVACPIWRRPGVAGPVWMAFNADTYAHDVLETAGAINVFAAAQERYPEFDAADERLIGAETVLLPSEPFAFGSVHAQEFEDLGKRVVLCAGEDLHWYGPNSVDGTARIRRLLRSGV